MGISIASWKNDHCKKCIGYLICDYQVAPDSEKCQKFHTAIESLNSIDNKQSTQIGRAHV